MVATKAPFISHSLASLTARLVRRWSILCLSWCQRDLIHPHGKYYLYLRPLWAYRALRLGRLGCTFALRGLFRVCFYVRRMFGVGI